LQSPHRLWKLWTLLRQIKASIKRLKQIDLKLDVVATGLQSRGLALPPERMEKKGPSCADDVCTLWGVWLGGP